MAEEIKLEPCQSCGSENVCLEVNKEYFPIIPPDYYVECKNCGTHTAWWNVPEAAIEKWNMHEYEQEDEE